MLRNLAICAVLLPTLARAQPSAVAPEPAPTSEPEPAPVPASELAPAPVPVTAPARGPAFAVGLDYTLGHGGHVEELDLGYRLEAGLFLRYERWQFTFSFPAHPRVRSSNPERDTESLSGFGLGARLAYRAPLLGGVLSIGGGITHRWIWAQEDVMRTCTQTGDCIAGTYLDRPSYSAWAPQLRIGVGPAKEWPRMVMGASFEIIVEAIGLNDVPPNGIREVAVSGAVTFTIGGGPRRR